MDMHSQELARGEPIAPTETDSTGFRNEMIELEAQLLTAIYSCDKMSMRRMMIPDGLGVDGSFGYATQESLIDGIHEFKSTNWKMSFARVLPVGRDGYIVTYRISQEVRSKQRTEPEEVYATTVWVMKNGRWMALFHQETPVLSNEMN